VTRVKYRGVAVADTARERPVLTVQLLDKQPRLTVSTIEDKRQALLAGLGVATMPYPLVEKDIAEGRLRVVSPEYTNEIDIIMAWRRDSMGEAKSWCLREIPSCLPADSEKTLSGRSRKISRKGFGSGPKRLLPSVPRWQLKIRITSQPMTGINSSSSHQAERSVSCRRRNCTAHHGKKTSTP
jgi:hypothetical protein